MNLLFSFFTVIATVPDTNAVTAIYRIDRFVWRKVMRRLTTRFAQKAPFYDFNPSVKWQLIEVNTNGHFPFRYLNPGKRDLKITIQIKILGQILEQTKKKY